MSDVVVVCDLSTTLDDFIIFAYHFQMNFAVSVVIQHLHADVSYKISTNNACV